MAGELSVADADAKMRGLALEFDTENGYRLSEQLE